MDKGIITAIIGVAGTLLGTILGSVLNCIYDRRKSKLKLCFSLQASKDGEDTDLELKTKYSTSGYYIQCYNVGSVPFILDTISLYYKKNILLDGLQAPEAEAIIPFSSYIYELNMQEYGVLLRHCKEFNIQECDVFAYDVSGKKCKSKISLFLPHLQSSIV